jgi:hypothetical protein
MAMELRRVTNLLFRCFLTLVEVAVLLNPADEELGQPVADCIFQGLQFRQQNPPLIPLAKSSPG